MSQRSWFWSSKLLFYCYYCYLPFCSFGLLETWSSIGSCGKHVYFWFSFDRIGISMVRVKALPSWEPVGIGWKLLLSLQQLGSDSFYNDDLYLIKLMIWALFCYRVCKMVRKNKRYGSIKGGASTSMKQKTSSHSDSNPEGEQSAITSQVSTELWIIMQIVTM